MAKRRGILLGPYLAESIRDPRGEYGFLEAQWSGDEAFAVDHDFDSDGLVAVSAAELERWEFSYDSFYSALADVNGLVGEVIELEGGILRIGRRVDPPMETVFVPASEHVALDLILISTQDRLSTPMMCALLAAPHGMSSAAVSRLADRGIALVDLTERLRDDLGIDWGVPYTESGGGDLELVLIEAAEQIVYKGHRLNIPPKPFGLLLYLARQPDGKYAHPGAALDKVIGMRVDGPARGLSDAVRRLRDSLQPLVEDHGLPAEEIARLIENKSGTGYRLTLPRVRVRII